MESNSSPMRVALVTGGSRGIGAAIVRRRKLTTIVDYIMADLHRSPTLEQMAALVSLSPYHFARQFKAATGLPPHQFLISGHVSTLYPTLAAIFRRWPPVSGHKIGRGDADAPDMIEHHGENFNEAGGNFRSL
jgi:regulatory helix-turn-helix AraC family protein